MAKAPDGLRVEREGDVLRVTIDRAERRNALDTRLVEALTHAFRDVGDARVVVLGADGPTFSVGGDSTPGEDGKDPRHFQPMFAAVDACPAPVVAGVRGQALGAGCGLVACCDIAVAAPDAGFALGEAGLGIVTADVSPFLLARIGTGAARRLIVTGERFDAGTALRIGLIHEIAPDLEGAVEHVVDEILTGGPEATRIAKRLARAPLPASETIEVIADRRASAEGQEGLRAFLERRPPSWRGEQRLA